MAADPPAKRQRLDEPARQPTVSYHALKRARRTIEDFVQSYFPFHGLDPHKDFFRHLDILVFVEGTIYQMDEENEALTQGGAAPEQHQLAGASASHRFANVTRPAALLLLQLSASSSVAALPVASWHPEFSRVSLLLLDLHTTTSQCSSGLLVLGAGEQVLLQVLRQKQLLSSALEAQMAQGREYWRLERQLCSLMLSAPRPAGQGAAFTLDTVHKASEAKSFDYRVLNLLLHALRNTSPDSAVLEFLFVDEHLVDIGDDLVDYEDDVLANSFNIYRAYVHLFGSAAQMRLVERISQFEARHQQLLQALPEHFRSAHLRRRSEAADVPGSEKWVFPAPILDEVQYRLEVAQAGSDSDSSSSESH